MVRRYSKEDVARAGGLPPVGWREVVVASCEEKHSSRGEAYYRVALADASTAAHVVDDPCMLAGRGFGIGLMKLEMLGGAERDGNGDLIVREPGDIRGGRVAVCVRHEAYDWNGQQRLRAKVDSTKGKFGYRPATGAAGETIPF